MELHTWATLGTLAASIDPECLAAIWLVSITGAPAKVLPSSNVYVSPERRLPCLINDGVIISGYSEIVHYLGTKGYVLGSDRPQDVALLALTEQLKIFTQWTLFCQEDNYREITRPQISASLPFPMQYNVAISLKRSATEAARARGLSKRLTDESGPRLSKLHSELLEQHKEQEKARQMPQSIMRVVARAEELYRTAGLLHQEMSPASLLLGANLMLQTLPSLPSHPLSVLVDRYPDLGRICAQASAISPIALDEPSAEKKYSLPNWLLSWTPWTPWTARAAPVLN